MHGGDRLPARHSDESGQSIAYTSAYQSSAVTGMQAAWQAGRQAGGQADSHSSVTVNLPNGFYHPTGDTFTSHFLTRTGDRAG